AGQDQGLAAKPGRTAHRAERARANRGSGSAMTMLRAFGRHGRIGLVLAMLLLPAGCVELTGNPGIPGSTAANAGSPVDTPTGQDAEDAVIGQREHPRIIATYGGIYADRPAEIMLAH